MIQLTKINHGQIIINSSLIETIEETPDTVITTTTGNKILVSESANEVIQKIIDYYRSIYGRPPEIL